MPWDEYKCPMAYCNFQSDRGRSLLHHFEVIHVDDRQFSSPCLFDRDCSNHRHPFKTVSNLKKHLQKFHGSFYHDMPDREPVLLAAENEDFVSSDHSPLDNESGTNQVDGSSVNESDHPIEAPIDVHMADFVLKLLAERKLNQTNVQFVIKESRNLMRQAAKSAIQEAATVAKNHGLHGEDVFLELLSKFADWDPFCGLKDQRSQNNYFKQKLGMIEPIRIALPRRMSQYGRHRRSRSQMYKNQNFFYVPLLEILERILNFNDVYEEINRPKNTSPDQYSCFESGRFFKENPLFKQHPNAIQINLYADEVQVSNELGSHTKKNKIVFVYFSLGNLSPKFRSSFKNIYLVSIFYNTQLVCYTPNIMMKPLLDDLKSLENGVAMTIQGKSTTIFGTMTAFVADNAASHLFGGFQMAFSSGYRKCRSCMGSENEIQESTFDDQFTARTKESHQIQCRELEVADLRDFYRRLYGIKYDSIFNELQYFNVICGLPPDIMHDILEGVLPQTMRLLILECLKRKYFSMKELNHIIKNYNYGNRECSQKPSEMDLNSLKNGSFRQSAAQTWVLAINLPLMIGAKVPDNLLWLCFTSLLNICRLVFSESLSEMDLFKLEHFIDEFLTYHKYLFTKRLSIKYHHLVHYVRHIRNFGPLLNYWCMRYESKHSYFKQLQRQIKNFINVPYTLSMRHQQWQCYQFKTSGHRLLEVKISGFGKRKPLCVSRDAKYKDVAPFFSLRGPFIETVKWITIGSTHFSVGSIVLCPTSSKYTFGKIENIFLHNSTCLFLCKLLKVIDFDEHYQAWQVWECCTGTPSNCSDCSYVTVTPLRLKIFREFTRNSPAFVNEPDERFFIPTKTEIESYMQIDHI